MINALNAVAEKIPAPTRPGREDALTRRDASKPAKMSLESADTESAVVEISSEGARRAQAREQGLAASAPQAPISSGQQGAGSAANSSPGLAQTLPAVSPEAGEALRQASSMAAPAGPAESAELSESAQFDEADANQDGTVNVLEKRAFDFLHPSLERYPGDEEDLLQPTIAAELKAYETVARSGRNL